MITLHNNLQLHKKNWFEFLWCVNVQKHEFGFNELCIKNLNVYKNLIVQTVIAT